MLLAQWVFGIVPLVIAGLRPESGADVLSSFVDFFEPNILLKKPRFLSLAAGDATDGRVEVPTSERFMS